MTEEQLMELCAAIEAMLFVCGDPASPNEMAEALGVESVQVQNALARLRERCAAPGSGLCLRQVEGKVQLCTQARFAEAIERLLQPVRKKSFSQSMLETLSIIAYKQPVTRAEIEAVRGVRCEYALQQLLHGGLIEVTGRKNAVGRPAQYGTTEKFLLHFGLSSLAELPRREEIRTVEEQERFGTV